MSPPRGGKFEKFQLGKQNCFKFSVNSHLKLCGSKYTVFPYIKHNTWGVHYKQELMVIAVSVISSLCLWGGN